MICEYSMSMPFLTLAQGHLHMKIKTGFSQKHFKIFFPGTAGLILMKLCMNHQRPKPFIFCSNYDPWLTLTYFMAKSHFATKAFIWENVKMMDSLEMIASCDLEFG